MNKIKFSHNYWKLPPAEGYALLLEVLEVKLENLSRAFINYDTMYMENGKDGYYKLPKKGDYLLLIFNQSGQ
jgi:hypothetical protein